MDSSVPPSFFPSASRIVCDIVSFQHFEHMWLVFEDLTRSHQQHTQQRHNDNKQNICTISNKQIKFAQLVIHMKLELGGQVGGRDVPELYKVGVERSRNVLLFLLTRVIRQKNQNSSMGGGVRAAAMLEHHRGQPHITKSNE